MKCGAGVARKILVHSGYDRFAHLAEPDSTPRRGTEMYARP
jgi:hypothetical protein